MITFGVVQLLLFFFPGLVCYLTYSYFTRDQRDKEDYKIITFNSLKYGIFIYLFTFIFYKKNSFIYSIITGTNKIDIKEFILSIFVAIILSIFLIINKDKGYIEQLFKKITKHTKSQHSTIFVDLMKSNDDLKEFKNKYARIVYKNSKLRYIGFITHYSFFNNEVELFLEDVSVYENDDEDPSYEINNLYINDSLNNFFIEYL